MKEYTEEELDQYREMKEMFNDNSELQEKVEFKVTNPNSKLKEMPAVRESRTEKRKRLRKNKK